jgi:hypothetical protein
MPLLVTLGAMIVVTHTIRHLSGRLGERWGGLLVGLPISVALTLLYCLWERGPQFAATAAQAGLLGLGAAVVFGAATARCLSGSPRLVLAVAAGAAAYVAVALLLHGVGVGLTLSVLLSLGLIAAGHRTVRGIGRRVGGCVTGRRLSPGWKLLLRTAVPVAFLTAILVLARVTDATWAGLLGTFPGTMLAVLVVTNLEAGPGAAVELLRTYPIGKCSTLAFLGAFTLLAPALGSAAGYAAACLASICVLAGMARSTRSLRCAEAALG